jgi:TPR repeat protein
MPSSTKRFSVSSVLYLVVLLGLVYMFHTELFVTGIRLYVTVVHNPRAEQLLGDYYQNNAQLSGELARNFYNNAMKNFKEQLSVAPTEQQALIKFNMGRLYLCGKGVETNASEAKRWLEEALALATSSDAKSQEMLIREIKEGLTFAKEGNKKIDKGNLIPPCHLQPTYEFFKLLS